MTARCSASRTGGTENRLKLKMQAGGGVPILLAFCFVSLEIGTDYDIHIDFNIDLSQFNIDCDIPERK